MASASGTPVPRVSVVMAAYNAASSVGAALRSISAQSYADWELIVVEDGSRDGTLAVLEEFVRQEPRCRVIVHDVNAGLPRSLNDALAVARGEYIARMDADDEALPDRLAVQVAFLDSRRDVDILGGGAWEMNEARERSGELRRREDHTDLARHIYLENPFIHPTVMARRTVFETLGGYDASFRRGQDYELWLRAYPRFRLHNLQEPLIRYMRRGTPRWRDAWYSSKVIRHALHREGRVLWGSWFIARPVAATAWARIRMHVQARR